MSDYETKLIETFITQLKDLSDDKEHCEYLIGISAPVFTCFENRNSLSFPL